MTQLLLDDSWRDRHPPLQESIQDGVDPGLGLLGRQFEDPQVVPGGAAGALLGCNRTGASDYAAFETFSFGVVP